MNTGRAQIRITVCCAACPAESVKSTDLCPNHIITSSDSTSGCFRPILWKEGLAVLVWRCSESGVTRRQWRRATSTVTNKRRRHMRPGRRHLRSVAFYGGGILSSEVSSGDPVGTEIDLLEIRNEDSSGVCLTPTRLRDDCRASGERGPRSRPLPLTDGELMARVSAGSVDSFVDLYDRYYERAYRVARSVCHDDGRAQEVVQDGFLSVWNSRANYRSQQGTVAAWVMTVVRYRAIDAARSNQRHASRRASDDQPITRSAGEDPCETAIKRDEAQRIQASLATLPDAQAEVITLAYYGQLSHTEIAAHLGVPRGTVKGRMRLGLQKLSADLKPAAA